MILADTALWRMSFIYLRGGGARVHDAEEAISDGIIA